MRRSCDVLAVFYATWFLPYKCQAEATGSVVAAPDDAAAVEASPPPKTPKDDKKYVSQYISAWGEQYSKFVSGGKDGKGGDDKKNAGNAAQNLAVVWSAAALAGVAGFIAVA
ncbi:hypothetical protein NLG97_g2226 [Lecanicillium saksenae]|uniref:Uncharacterized protein n=1 Tax=Lecanicillium saksenae TaxID=468837 RepID=A0ACC1R1E5_9HYPO|nr:hypothetical protein NLG97_g2226 [Lecanicillium saksenae]